MINFLELIDYSMIIYFNSKGENIKKYNNFNLFANLKIILNLKCFYTKFLNG